MTKKKEDNRDDKFTWGAGELEVEMPNEKEDKKPEKEDKK